MTHHRNADLSYRRKDRSVASRSTAEQMMAHMLELKLCLGEFERLLTTCSRSRPSFAPFSRVIADGPSLSHHF